MQADLTVLVDGKVKKMTVKLAQPVRLIPVHIKGRPPSYFIIAGLVFSQVALAMLCYITIMCIAQHDPVCLNKLIVNVMLVELCYQAILTL